MENAVVLGVDIGGTHITAALVDLELGLPIQNTIKREIVNSKGEKEEILNSWTEVIKSALGNTVGDKYIGIAMPGPFDYEQGISLMKDQDKFNALYKVNIKEELATRLGIDKNAIKFINDAAAFMQGELFNGAAKGYSNAIGLTLGTGLGSAIAINGIAKDAALWDAKFLNGIAEDYISTRWFVNAYKTLTGKDVNGVKELAELVDSDPCVVQIFNEFGQNLAQFLANFIKKNNSAIVVLGGNIAQAFDLFASSLREGLAAHHLATTIKLSCLNENAALIGAASIGINTTTLNITENLAHHYFNK